MSENAYRIHSSYWQYQSSLYAFTNHRDTEKCFALKFEIGPPDSPPFGRGPSFEIRSAKQIQNPKSQMFKT